MSICEFFASKMKSGKSRYSAKNYDNGTFLKERRVIKAEIIGHIDIGE